jgi:hypothetical protein
VVNEVTDFVVETEFQRTGRKVAAIKFRIRRVPGKAKAVPTQQHLFPDETDQPMVVRELKQAGIDSAEAWKIYQQGARYILEEFRPDMSRYDADPERAMEKYVREKIDLMKRRRAEGKIKSAAGFLHQAIRKNYEHPEASLEAQLSEQRRKAKESGQIKRRQDTLVYQREKLGMDRDVALHNVCEEILRENQELLETAVSALTASDLGFRNMYDARKTAPENYKSPRVYIFVDQWLEGKYPERFAAVRAEYATKAADFDQ